MDQSDFKAISRLPVAKKWTLLNSLVIEQSPVSGMTSTGHCHLWHPASSKEAHYATSWQSQSKTISSHRHFLSCAGRKGLWVVIKLQSVRFWFVFFFFSAEQSDQSSILSDWTWCVPAPAACGLCAPPLVITWAMCFVLLQMG